MKNAERDGLVLMLAVASGSADGWSYFGLAHAFVANMTGNTVLLGISIFYLHGDVVHPLIGIAGYLAGVVVGTLICRRVPEGVTWARPVSWALFLESLLLLAVEAAWVAMHQHPSATASDILLACVALAIGIQTTSLTGGLTLLAAHQPRVEREKTKLEERLSLQAAVLAVYFLSALLTGWAFRHAPAVVGGISAVAVLLVAGYSALRN